jgi:amidase
VKTLVHAASILLATKIPDEARPSNIYLIRETFSISDDEVRQALQNPLRRLREIFGNRVREISIREIDQEPSSTDMDTWNDIYRVLQRAEAESCLGGWVAEQNPDFGSLIGESFQLIRALDRTLLPSILERRETYARRLHSFLSSNDLLCIPTSPTPAPLKGSILRRDGPGSDYYSRALSLTSIAGIGRLPQISLPVTETEGLPLGLSLLARNREDPFLLAVASQLEL